MDNLSSFLAGALVGAGAVLLLATQNGVQIPWAMEEFESQILNGLNDSEEKVSTAWDAPVMRQPINHEMIRDSSRSAL